MNASTSANSNNGLVSVKSAHDVKTTADRLETILGEKGMTVMARINHTQGAEKIGEHLRPTELVLFGNPKAGTPLMQSSQTSAIDLPQKALIWEDESAQVWLSYNDPEYMAQRHNIEGKEQLITNIGNALSNIAQAATGQ